MRKCQVIIPARMASTRLPRKPLQLLDGVPLIVRVCQNVQSSGIAANISVATDDVEIVDLVQKAGFQAIMTDPALPSGTDRVAVAANLLELDKNSIILNVQGDEPFLKHQTMQKVVALVNSELNPIATAVEDITSKISWENPNVVKAVLNNQNQALYFSRSPIPHPRDEDFPSLYIPKKHIGIYAYTKEALDRITLLPEHPLELVERLEQLRWLANGEKIVCANVDPSPAGIDTPEDLERAQKYLNIQ